MNSPTTQTFIGAGSPDTEAARARDGADAVVNLLTHIPSVERMADPSAWEENTRLRTEASAAIARAAQAARVQRLVQESSPSAATPRLNPEGELRVVVRVSGAQAVSA